MPKIQTSLGLTPESKSRLDFHCKRTGFSQNEIIENLIKNHVLPIVKLNCGISDYTCLAVITDDPNYFSDIIVSKVSTDLGVYKSVECFSIPSFEGTNQELERKLKILVQAYDKSFSDN